MDARSYLLVLVQHYPRSSRDYTMFGTIYSHICTFVRNIWAHGVVGYHIRLALSFFGTCTLRGVLGSIPSASTIFSQYQLQTYYSDYVHSTPGRNFGFAVGRDSTGWSTQIKIHLYFIKLLQCSGLSKKYSRSITLQWWWLGIETETRLWYT